MFTEREQSVYQSERTKARLIIIFPKVLRSFRYKKLQSNYRLRLLLLRISNQLPCSTKINATIGLFKFCLIVIQICSILFSFNEVLTIFALSF